MNLPTLEELEAFFGVEATVGAPEAPWQQSSLTLEVEAETETLSVRLIPPLASVEFRWVGKPFRVFGLRLEKVSDVTVVRDPDGDHLKVKFESPDLDDFAIFLKPLCVFWGNAGNLEYDA